MNDRRLRRPLTLLASATVLIGVGYGVAHVRAAGVPTLQPLWYSGTVADSSGKPLDGEYQASIRLFAQQERTPGEEPACKIEPTDVSFVEGRFRMDVSDCAAALQASPDLFVELTIDGNANDNNPGTPFARSKIGAVPFALEAQHAVSASAASGELKDVIDGLTRRGTRVVRKTDSRNGCPAKAAATADLVTLSFTLAQPTPVQITGDVIRLHQGRADISLIVDGALQFIGVTQTDSLTWAPGHVAWAGTLAAGDHVAIIRSGGDKGYAAVADIWGCGEKHGALTAVLFE